MDYYSGYINQLIEQLSRLPGIGVKPHSDWPFIL